MQEEAGNLAFWAFIGFLLIMIGLTGRLGSILGSFIDPSAMEEGSHQYDQGVAGGGTTF